LNDVVLGLFSGAIETLVAAPIKSAVSVAMMSITTIISISVKALVENTERLKPAFVELRRGRR
jgi:hypothetical protein